MKRLLLLLCCVLLLLLAGAATALASYPASAWKTETAYVHIWWGSAPTLWTEFDSLDPDTANWIWHVDGEAIPKGYDVCLAVIMWGSAPRGQLVGYRNNMPLEFEMDGPDVRMPLAMEPREARNYWNPVELAWLWPQIHKEDGKMWGTSWTFDELGPLAPGTYSGESTYSVKHRTVDFSIPDELPDGPLKPTHYDPVSPVTAPFAFTVDDE